MIIGIDITMLVYTGSGVANYTYNLVKNLLEIDKKNKYRLFYSSLRRPKNFYYLDKLRSLGASVYEWPIPPSVLEFLWGKSHLVPIEMFTGKVDVFYTSDYLRPPLMMGTKGITTVHDLIWKLYPDLHERRIIEAHERKLQKIIKYRDTVVVDSSNTKNDLLRLYPQFDKRNIRVIYPGVRNDMAPIEDKQKIEKILSKYFAGFSIANTKYLLYVGAIEPRKNLDIAIRAFHKLTTDHQSLVTNFLIAGKMGWKNESIYKLVHDLKLEDRVKFIGFVEDADLPYLYSGAKLLIYLSSYEGFGLPPLEALACGTKVLAGDNSSMKETIDEKYLVDIKNEAAVTDKMTTLLADKSEVDWKKIKNKFSWKKAAREFLKILA